MTWKRACERCNLLLIEGYCIESGMAYYCSDKCLNEHFSKEEWKCMYDDGKGDSYWTSWVDEII